MCCWKRLASALGVLAGLALFLGPQTAQAQQKEKKVSFTTADGVELSGTFYPGNKTDPTVMLLHPIGKGEDSSKAGWDSLAKALNKKGYSVLRFDFRGHGDSTTIDPQKFWNRARFPANSLYVKADKAQPGIITVENYGPAYYPILINDIAAAKSYLDRQNDAGACNSSSLVVVSAANAGALASVWLNSEWQRYKVLPPEQQKPWTHFADDPEGKGTVAAVFLSINPKLSKKMASGLPLERILYVPGQVRAVPMLFLYGDKDSSGQREAKRLEKYLKTNKFKNQQFTGATAIPGAGKAAGRELLQRGLATEGAVVDWLGAVLAKTPEWTELDFRKSTYAWGRPVPPFGRVPPTAVQAKGANETVIRWNSYAQFMR